MFLPLSPRLTLPTLPIIVGVLTLIGWTWDINVLKQAIASSVAMNPATAVGFILLGLAALQRYAITNASWANRVGYLAIFIVIIASAMKLSDLVLGTSFHIDQQLFSSKLALEVSYPSRMAPNTAFCLFTLGWAMLFLYSSRNAQSE